MILTQSIDRKLENFISLDLDTLKIGDMRHWLAVLRHALNIESFNYFTAKSVLKTILSEQQDVVREILNENTDPASKRLERELRKKNVRDNRVRAYKDNQAKREDILRHAYLSKSKEVIDLVDETFKNTGTLVRDFLYGVKTTYGLHEEDGEEVIGFYEVPNYPTIYGYEEAGAGFTSLRNDFTEKQDNIASEVFKELQSRKYLVDSRFINYMESADTLGYIYGTVQGLELDGSEDDKAIALRIVDLIVKEREYKIAAEAQEVSDAKAKKNVSKPKSVAKKVLEQSQRAIRRRHL